MSAAVNDVKENNLHKLLSEALLLTQGIVQLLAQAFKLLSLFAAVALLLFPLHHSCKLRAQSLCLCRQTEQCHAGRSMWNKCSTMSCLPAQAYRWRRLQLWQSPLARLQPRLDQPLQLSSIAL